MLPAGCDVDGDFSRVGAPLLWLLSAAMPLGWPRLGHGGVSDAHFSEGPMDWPCETASPVEIKASLAD